MAKGAKNALEAGIARLESTNGDPTATAEQAARLVGLDLSEFLERCLKEGPSQSNSLSSSFKEQWLLRWVLKTLNLAEVHSGDKNGTSTKYLFSEHFWVLLIYLISTIPKNACLEILSERKFFQHLGPFLRDVDSLVDGGEHISSKSAHIGEESQPSKRRKVSSSDRHGIVTSSAPALLSTNLRIVLLHLIGQCITLVRDSDDNCERPGYLPFPRWSSTWAEKALLVASTFRMTIHISRMDPRSRHLAMALNKCTNVLALWTDATSKFGFQDEESHTVFNSSCLLLCLNILEILHGSTTTETEFSSLRQMTERCVAVHVILPARMAFQARQRKGRKSKADTLSWAEVEPLLKDLHDKVHLPLDTGHHGRSLFAMVFDIAARVVLTSDLRKRHSEQQWLDSLLLALAHKVCPLLPEISPHSHTDESVRLSGIAISRENLVPLENLLCVTVARKIRPSLSVLGYVLEAVLGWNQGLPLWQILPLLIKIDVNILLAPTGLSKSETWLHQVCGLIEGHEVTKDAYDSIKDDIIRPLMHGFARSRDFEGFAKLWDKNLAEAMRVQYSAPRSAGKLPAVFVWDNDDIFGDFKVLTAQHAPQGLEKKALAELYEPFSSIANKAGSVLGLVSKASIYIAILQGMDERDYSRPLPTDQFAVLIEAAVAALQKRSDYQGQRSRLWRVIRYLLLHVSNDDVSGAVDALIQSEAATFSASKIFGPFVALRSATKLADNREYLEYFSLLIDVAERRKDMMPTFLSEMQKLIEGLTLRQSQTPSTEPAIATLAWMEGLPEITSVDSFAQACACRILQNPQILSRASLAPELLVSLCLRLPGDTSLYQSSLCGTPLASPLQALLDVDLVLENTTARKLLFEHLLEHASGSLSWTAIHTRIAPYLSTKEMKTLESLGERASEDDHLDGGNQGLRIASEKLPMPEVPMTQESVIEHSQQIGLDSLLSKFGLVYINSQNQPNEDINIMVTATKSYAESLDGSSFPSCIKLLRSLVTSGENRLVCPLLLAAFIVQVKDVDIRQHSMIANELGEVAALSYLPANVSPASLLLAFDSCRLVLEQHPQVVNQSTLDRLLASLCHSLSVALADKNTTKELYSNVAEIVFGRVCAIVGCVLGKFRRRLSDRYHLLLPVLQRLLKCLFWPGTKALQYLPTASSSYAVVAFGRSLPQWLASSEYSLPPSSAETFSRLLSSICNPSVSAARSSKHRGHSNLNDQTKTAKKQAGQYMQYLVIEYARCSLDGQIPPEVKEKLMPGLYMVMNSMDKDLMRSANAAMDASSRAIFKSLYDDWIRFAKWDNS